MFHVLEQQRFLKQENIGGKRSFKFHTDWNFWFLNIF